MIFKKILSVYFFKLRSFSSKIHELSCLSLYLSMIHFQRRFQDKIIQRYLIHWIYYVLKNSPIMKSFLYFYGSPTWNRTKINGFGDRYTNRCAMELDSVDTDIYRN